MGGVVDHLEVDVPCRWRVRLDAGPAIAIRMAGEEERVFHPGTVGLPLMAGGEIVVMLVKGPR